MLLTSAQIISKYCLPTHSRELPHVTKSIDAFLDVFSPSWSFAEIFSKSGSLHLMQYVSSKEPSRSMDPFYRRYLFNRTTWFAAERRDLDAVKWLVESFLPQEFLTKVVNGAAAGGHVKILQWLFDKCYDRACWGGIEMCRALINEHFEAVEWLKRNAPPRRECMNEIMQAAGKAGNVDIIWWLYEEHGVDAEDALWSAQMESKYDTARWIFENCEMEYPTIDWQDAARCGDLEFLKFAYSLENGCPNKDAMHAAAASGRLDVLEWLYSEVGLPLRSEAARYAARNGHLQVVKWFKDNDCPGWEIGIMNAAATGGHLKILKWLRENCNDECNVSTMNRAVRGGYVDVVKWLNDNYTIGELSAFVMYTAARLGHLEVVKWLHTNGCEGSAAAMDGAARFGHLEIVKWLQQNRTEGCTVQAMNWAAESGHLDVVKWLHANRTEGCTTRAMDAAARSGHVSVVKWLHFNRSEGCTRDAMTQAIRNGNFEIALFLDENRSEGFNSQTTLLEHPCLELTQWLLSKYPEQIDGWTFALPAWDWHFSDWCRQVDFQQTPEAITEWICDSSVVRRST
ncbi:hypothetical protein L916_19721 [Phytophthora nicotianae]|uniref:Uncharacterized protein n=2 Tax=Phytophthora nicotianae TaxID=4792 RepID=W2HXJ1_PHYNI|nr:hypothetical protein L916_19721 [Phytophthora nicotianae]